MWSLTQDHLASQMHHQIQPFGSLYNWLNSEGLTLSLCKSSQYTRITPVLFLGGQLLNPTGYSEGTFSSSSLFPRPSSGRGYCPEQEDSEGRGGRTCTLLSFEHSLNSLIQQTFIKRLCVPGPRDRELCSASALPSSSSQSRGRW